MRFQPRVAGVAAIWAVALLLPVVAIAEGAHEPKSGEHPPPRVFRLFDGKDSHTFPMRDATGQMPEVIMFDQPGVQQRIARMVNEAIKRQLPPEKQREFVVQPWISLLLRGVALERVANRPDLVRVNLIGRFREIPLGYVYREQLERGELVPLHYELTRSKLYVAAVKISSDVLVRLNPDTRQLELHDFAGTFEVRALGAAIPGAGGLPGTVRGAEGPVERLPVNDNL